MSTITGYWQASLAKMIDTIGEEAVKEILASFSCPLNQDVEYFLHHKAIEFCKQCISATHLVFASYHEKPVLVGYYTLASKIFVIRNTTKLSANLRKRINKFGNYNPELRQYEVPVPLIGQLGKNYANEYNRLITGDELLHLAFDRIRTIHMCMGGKMAFLECAPIPSLIRFYERNGFVQAEVRTLSPEEIGLDGHDAYMQMIKYF